jgi:phenylacetate-CoA ligase
MIYNLLTEKIIYPLFDLMSGRDINKLYIKYRENQWKSQEAIEAKQFRDLKKLIVHAYKTVPYYQNLFDKKGLKPSDIKNKKDLLKIPTLTRDDITKNSSKLISRKFDRTHLIASQSGGSTGQPINFFQDLKCLDSHKAALMRFHINMGLRLGDRTVKIWGAPREINASKTLKGQIFEKLNNRLFLDGFDLSEKTMADYVSKIQKFKPKLIMGYVQCLDMLAQYIRKHKIKGIRPKASFTTSSVLYPHIRKRIENTLGCQVYDEYGACELGPVAHECDEHRGLHIDTEICYVEFIKNGKPAKPNEEAELIITTLTNYGMPLIRYEVGDVGSYTKRKCSCKRGLPLMNDLVGRTFGVFTAMDGRKVHGYYFTNRLFMQMPNVKQFQMIQKTKKDYLIKIVKNPEFGNKDSKHIEKMLKEKLGKGIKIRYQFLKKINPESSGKYLYTKSHVKEGY